MTEQQTIAVPVGLINALYQYLGTQPYKQVSPLMKAMESLGAEPAPVEESTEEPKEDTGE